ncbi:MAG: hypothetical protein AAGH64_05020 [Planctomycetota bacterium]
MIVFPLYAVLAWWITWMLPARWMRLAFIPIVVAVEMIIATILIYRFPRPADEPPPLWLLNPAWGYGALLAAGCLLITFAKPRPDHLCHACGYDLSGNEFGICPECGAVARCRNCKQLLVHDDFGPCPNCKEPFPRFAPVSKVKDDDERAPREHRDTSKLIKKYVEHAGEGTRH